MISSSGTYCLVEDEITCSGKVNVIEDHLRSDIFGEAVSSNDENSISVICTFTHVKIPMSKSFGKDSVGYGITETISDESQRSKRLLFFGS